VARAGFRGPLFFLCPHSFFSFIEGLFSAEKDSGRIPSLLKASLRRFDGAMGPSPTPPPANFVFFFFRISFRKAHSFLGPSAGPFLETRYSVLGVPAPVSSPLWANAPSAAILGIPPPAMEPPLTSAPPPGSGKTWSPSGNRGIPPGTGCAHYYRPSPPRHTPNKRKLFTGVD